MALALVLALYVPLAVGALFAADWVVTTVFSDRYAAAAPAVKWLTGALVMYGIAYLARTGTIALGRRSGIAQIAVITLVVNVAMNVALIPTYGFEAAAAATFVTEVVDAVLLVILFVRTAGGLKFEGFVATPLVAGAVMAAVLWVADLDGAAVLVAGPLVYFAALALGTMLFAPDAARQALRSIRKQAPSGAPLEP
jgi:O-antigen/teichoic acid export membrane protein